MGFDLEELRLRFAQNSRVARILVAASRGSAPREPGTAMLVWAQGQSGTIGGGALELRATEIARDALRDGPKAQARQMPLGPNLGQCCGGSVELVIEIFEQSDLAQLGDGPVNSPVNGPVIRRIHGQADRPFGLSRALTDARNGTQPLSLFWKDGWLAEPLAQPSRQIWVWGAGHVGRALVGVLGQLPDLAITWVDTAPNRFPPEEDPQSQVSGQVTRLVAQDLCLAATHAPANAEHYILTYSHEFDLGLCHQLLSQPARHIGLIGSATKWARFKTRLSALGHPPLDLARIQCPIGDPSLGKHPQAIALGVASDILRASQRSALSQQEQSL